MDRVNSPGISFGHGANLGPLTPEDRIASVIRRLDVWADLNPTRITGPALLRLRSLVAELRAAYADLLRENLLKHGEHNE
jgi:hypothetical protein